jgi:hypothetical protein
MAYDRTMARTQTMVQLTDELVAALDREAERSGRSRSAVIREAIEYHLAQRGRAAALRRYTEGYQRMPPAVPDEWGDPEEEADRHGRELAQRLDAEERAAGLTW